MAFKPGCSECGSFAINHQCHGRDGSDGHLCDVCYWRKRAEVNQVYIVERCGSGRDELLAALDVMRTRLDYSDPHGDAPMVLAAIAKAKGGNA